MKLSDRISEDLKAAMKAKDKLALEALRAAKTAFILAKTQEGAAKELSDEDELKIIQRLIKQRKESADIYAKESRSDLAEKELAEAKVLGNYLPAQMDSESLRSVIKSIIEKTGAAGIKDMGKVMGTAGKELAGKADNKDIAAIVKELLSV